MELCSAVGLDCRDAEPVKLTVNAVFRLPREGCVVRIAHPVALIHRVEKVVRIARWLARHDLPAVRLLPGLPAPVRVGVHIATVWVDAGKADPPPGPADLAAILRQLHALPEPDHPPLPAWDPLDDVRRRLCEAEALAEADLLFLRGLVDDIGERLARVRYALPAGFVHGDAHLGNLVRGQDGRVVLCDFDASCHGPVEWDLVPVAVGRIRFGHPDSWQETFAAEYGFDVTTWPYFEVLRALRELKLVTSVVPVLADRPSAAAQFRLRLASLRSNDCRMRWTRYG